MAIPRYQQVLSIAVLLSFVSRAVFEANAVEYASQFENDVETILPPYVDSDGAPTTEVTVVYTTNSTVGKVQLGQLYARNETQAEPEVTFLGNAIQKHDFYTLVTVDPDARNVSNILHWLVVNIPGDMKSFRDIGKVGDEIVPYRGPAPPSGTHRYIFLLFCQGRRKIHPPVYPRPLFSVRNFTDTYHLGWPLGGTLFRASFNDE